MITPNELWTMGLHQVGMIDYSTQVQRVPGGWIYTMIVRDSAGPTASRVTSPPISTSSVFVPWIGSQEHERQQENERTDDKPF
jgi:hypothetical protein